MKWLPRVCNFLTNYRQSLRAQSVWLRGLQSFHDQRYSDALDLLRQAQQLSPDEYGPMDCMHESLVGRCLYAEGRHGEAIDRLERSVAVFENSDKLRRAGFHREQYIATVKALAAALEHSGEPSLAAEAKRQLRKLPKEET